MSQLQGSIAALVTLGSFASVSCFVPTIGPAPVKNTLVVIPLDGATGLTTLELDTGLSPGPSDGQFLTLLEMSATLATWPDETPVPDVVSATLGPTIGGGVALKPVTPVAEGWYELIYPALPSNVHLAPQDFHWRSDGRASVRVRVGSAPAPWHLGACSPNGSTTIVTLTFSEVVHAATTSTMPLDLSAGPPTAPVTCTTETPPLVDRPTDEYAYACTRLASGDVVVITITDGFLSGTGVSVPVGKRSVPFGPWPADDVMPGCSEVELEP